MQELAEATQNKPLYPRVLLKISGEALMGDQGFGLHPSTLPRSANVVQKAHERGTEVRLVTGGGSSFRGLGRGQVGRRGGFEVKQMGDGFMLAFANPVRAVACAVDIQRAVACENRDGISTSIRVSAGLNSGAAIREGDDFFGHTVNVASRIADRADGGQVLISEATRALIGQMDGVRIVDTGRRRLRGIAPRHRLFEVVWRE